VVEVGVASGSGLDAEQFTTGEVFGEEVELPAQNHHVGGGKGEREFFRGVACARLPIRRRQ